MLPEHYCCNTEVEDFIREFNFHPISRSCDHPLIICWSLTGLDGACCLNLAGWKKFMLEAAAAAAAAEEATAVIG